MNLTLIEILGVLSIVVVTSFSKRLGLAAPLALVVVGIALSYLPGTPDIPVRAERVVEDGDLRQIYPALPSEFDRGRIPERWVVVQVEEAYMHCRKHIPRMVPVLRQRNWGTDDTKRRGGDFFGAKGQSRPWHEVTASSS